MACPNCGGATAPEDAFCANCGTNLAETPVTCPNCAKVNEPKAAFCTSCGTNLKAEPAAQAPAKEHPAPKAKPASSVEAAPIVEAPAPPPPPEVATTVQQEAAAPTTEQPFATTPEQAEPAAAAPAGKASANPLLRVSLISAAVAAIGSFLSWFDVFGATSNAYDIAVQFILDYQTSAGNTISIGLVVLVCAGVAAALASFWVVGNRLWIIRFLGLVLVAVAAAFLVQLSQAADSIGASFGDVYAIGPFLTLAGGVGLLSGK